MATWVGILLETRDRSDLWEVVARLGVAPRAQPASSTYVLIDCGVEFERVMGLARQLSEALQASALGFVVQTSSDVHQIHAFSAGQLVRQLDYNRDAGGWVAVTGTPQGWERPYFLGAGEDPFESSAIEPRSAAETRRRCSTCCIPRRSSR